MKRTSLAVALAFAAALLTTQSAFAARIYNFLPTKVWVTGQMGALNLHQVTLAAGERSDSLGWSTANVARVDLVTSAAYSSNNRPLCMLNFGVHADIQGGNYMTIGVRGGDIVCTLCGSEHNVMQTDVVRNTYGWKPSRTGC